MKKENQKKDNNNTNPVVGVQPGAGDQGGEGTKEPGAGDQGGEGTKDPGAGDQGGEGTKEPGTGDQGGEGTKEPGAGDQGTEDPDDEIEEEEGEWELDEKGQEQLAKLKKAYPDHKKFYFTTDQQPFFEEQFAKEHQRTVNKEKKHLTITV